MPEPRTLRLAMIAMGVGMLVAGCSSSSSPSGSPTPTAFPPSYFHGHQLVGPNGYITAPASNPPASGVPGGSEVFPHISQQLDKQLFDHVSKMSGVERITYYPQL